MNQPTTTARPDDLVPPADGAWNWIDDVDRLPPFLMFVVSHDDVWLFVTSNGGVTAGRSRPERSLFAYTSQDRLVHRAGSTGALTLLRVHPPGQATPTTWRPLDPEARGVRRGLGKRVDGTQVCFEEDEPATGLRFRATWGTSRRFGVVRRCTLENVGSQATAIDLLDGWQDLQAHGLDDDFLVRYSALADAYKRGELLADSGLRLVTLSSLPTDRAEPSESLRCNVVWTAGLDGAVSLGSVGQVEAFLDGAPVAVEHEVRGQRAACLAVTSFVLAPGARRTWYIVGDVGLSAARAASLHQLLRGCSSQARADLIERELEVTATALRQVVASGDGLQCTADTRRGSRHFSNVMFNLMRGGVPLDGHEVPLDAWIRHLAHFDRLAPQRHAGWLASLPGRLPVTALVDGAAKQGDPSLERLARSLMPFTFGRRHGDPSRPWNRFEIRVRDAEGNPRLAWEGNWRDIFQNWEATLHTFPAFIENAIACFLNASTADGHNPYRITSEGIDWERQEQDDAWSNIGYWGDHQVVYLLRLLQASLRYHPGALDQLLDRPVFAYARVPYRIAPYQQLLRDPRRSITYDHAAEAHILALEAKLGADGRLVRGADGSVHHVTLFEKLLLVLLARLASFVPQGGIWMNTQRPEWNDANNALAGYGLSVVTMAWCHAYADQLLAWWTTQPDDRAIPVGRELASLLEAQATALAELPAERRRAMDALGEPASAWRQALYDRGPSGETVDVTFGSVRTWLVDVRRVLAESVRDNRRPDGLYHSYNLLRLVDGGADIGHLDLMLEGQVAVMSSGVADAGEVLAMARALRASPLYRDDQRSYLLYPDRDLPRYLDKNRIPPDEVARSPLVRALAEDPSTELVEVDATGVHRFGGDSRNARDLLAALAGLPERWQPLVEREGAALAALFERVFRHDAFTGRSSTFFAYEGLGSIYWHMVSKAALAIQEQALAARDPEVAEGLARAYHAVVQGLGVHKDPAHYGSFPTDACSHTPRHAGAQQPGMTGQVKEDILTRLAELGVVVEHGALTFRPTLLLAGELLPEARSWSCLDVRGQPLDLDVPAGGLAFTFCQVPVVYRTGGLPGVTLRLADGSAEVVDGFTLPRSWSAAIFARDGRVRWVEVGVRRETLREV